MRGFRVGKWHLSLGITFLLVGVLVGLSFRGQQQWQLRDRVRKQRLVDVIRSRERQRGSLEKTLENLRRRLAKREASAARGQGRLSDFLAESEALSRKAGLTPVKGDGLQVVIGDAPRVPGNADPYNYVVHDFDLQIIVNALWAGKARAIAINDQRLTAVSGIRGAGATVLVNNQPVGSPYKISAVGDSKKLLEALRVDPDARQLLSRYARNFDLVTRVSVAENLSVPAYKGSVLFEGVRAIEDGG